MDDAGSDGFVWFDTGVVWRDSDALPGNVLADAEPSMGISNTGGFIYSPSVDGLDSVWTHDGLLLQEGDPAPTLPGTFMTNILRPTMLPDGTAYWIGGLTGTTSGLALFRSIDTATPVIDVVLKTGDLVSGFALDSLAVDVDYQVSDDGSHYIQVVDLATGSSATDGGLVVDGVLVAQEASPASGAAENWDNFQLVSINDDGDYVFTGDMDGSTATDDFIAYNGVVAVREGDEVDGITVGGGLIAASINNLGQVAHLWSLTGTETLFVGVGSTLAASSVRILGTGDLVDSDDDGSLDAVIEDFVSSVVGPGLWLAEDGFLYVRVSLERTDTPGSFLAILRVPTSIIPSTTPGEVPAIALERLSPTSLRISWDASACGGVEDYGIYEGTLGSWDSHTMIDCSDDGADRVEDVSASAESTFYLVVPRDGSTEGSYGRDSAGCERLGGEEACGAFQYVGCPVP